MSENNKTTPSTYHSFAPLDDLLDSPNDDASMTEDKKTATAPRPSTPTTPNNEENKSPSREPSESTEHPSETFDSKYFRHPSAEEQNRSTYHSFVPLTIYPAYKNDENYNTAEDFKETEGTSPAASSPSKRRRPKLSDVARSSWQTVWRSITSSPTEETTESPFRSPKSPRDT